MHHEPYFTYKLGLLFSFEHLMHFCCRVLFHVWKLKLFGPLVGSLIREAMG